MVIQVPFALAKSLERTNLPTLVLLVESNEITG